MVELGFRLFGSSGVADWGVVSRTLTDLRGASVWCVSGGMGGQANVVVTYRPSQYKCG
jgi:hypothetical protein